MFEVGEKSFDNPSAMLPDGNIILLRAAMEPLIPTRNIRAAPAAAHAKYFRLSLPPIRRPLLADHAVTVNRPKSISVLKRRAAIQKGRAGVKVSAVFPVRTRPCPERHPRSLRIQTRRPKI